MTKRFVTIFAISFAGFGGIQRLLGAIVRELEATGCDVAVISLQDPPSATSDSVMACGRSKTRMIRAAVVALAGRRPDVVVIGHVLLLPLVALALVRRPRRLVLLTYGVEVWKPATVWQRWLVRQVDVVLTISSHSEASMASGWDVRPTGFCRLTLTAPNAPAQLQVARDETKILVVSRLTREDRMKYVDLVILAMAAIRRQVPGAHLEIVGDGDLRPELEALARSEGVADIVKFLGAATDAELDRSYASSAIFVLPSVLEGFGLVFLEAWQRGLAVVCSNKGAAPEVVRHEVDGFCVEAKPGDIASAVVTLLQDRELRHRLAASGSERARVTFGPDAFRTSVLRGVLGV